jgi:putative oxidoreductase
LTTGNATVIGLNAPVVQTARDVVLLVARVGLAVIMIAHAKLMYDFAGGIGGVGQLYAQSGVPLPAITGPANVLFEFVGGVAMILGLAVPVVGVLMALNMVGAWIFVHTSALFAMDHNGPELVITIGLLSLVLAAVGSGRFGLDHLIVTRARRKAGTAAGR